jgi:hypothetical protein
MKLGQDLDILSGIVPVDLGTAANTGHRVHMTNYGGLTVVGFLATGTAAQAPTFSVQEHDAATAGTSQALAVVDRYYTKAEATLDGDETWVETLQTAAATVTDATWDDANQVLVAFSIEAEELSDGFEWLSVDVADPGTSHIGAVLYVPYDLKIQRAPQDLADANT